jgi:hypothetical protein
VLEAAAARGIQDPELTLNLALMLDAADRRRESLAVLDGLLAQGDAVADALRGAGLLTRAALRLAARDAAGALADARSAVTLLPQRADAWFNLAEAALAGGEAELALDAARRATEIDPAHGLAHIDAALATAVLGDFPAAESALASVRAEFPAAFAAFRNAARPELEAPLRHLDVQGLFVEWHHERARRCDWRLRGLFERRMAEALEPDAVDGAGFEQTSIPFRSLAIPLSLPARGRLAARAGRLLAAHAGEPLPPPVRRARQAGDPIRVGYLSADFREHPLGWLTRDLYAAHDRSRVRVFGYSVSALPDDRVTHAIAAGMDDFRRCAALDSREIARMVREDGIDVLVDLGGYQMDARLEVFALGAAPIQVAWLGYPGSTGIARMTHAFVDEVACPRGSESAWTEALVRLPGSYFLGGDGRVPESPDLTREGLGLPEDGVVMCAFNQPWKIEQRVFDCWMEILRRVPEAVLWLFEPAHDVGANIRKTAESMGIDLGRLVFAPAWPHERHLARYRFADLFLDCWICNAHTTAADALAADLPLVSLAGEAFHQRVGASLLGALGCGELVAVDPASYLERAVALARDSASRRRWSVRLREGRAGCDVFAPARKARVLEEVFRSLTAPV